MSVENVDKNPLLAFVGKFFPVLMDFPVLTGLLMLSLLFAVAMLTLPLTRFFLTQGPLRLLYRGNSTWLKTFQESRFLARLSWAVPLLVIYRGLQFVSFLPPEVLEFFSRLAQAGLLLVVVRSLSALLARINTIYNRLPAARKRPINSYLQVINLVTHVLATVVMVAILVGQSPWYFISGLGAMTAVTMLVFRDTLLSLVAGIQLTTNDLIRLGDWIEMPQFAADGDVVDISLHAVRVQNWDKTITVIPTHKFLDHAFKNWRGMQESGGRRIKRALNISLSSIRFLHDEEVENFGRFALLQDYIAEKKGAIAAYNREHNYDSGLVVNTRRLTNVGTLRAYIINYLRQHPQIRKDMTFLVRQLEPGAQGLPIEIYVFVADTAWAVYEGVQADIFDHILAVVPEFDLRIFQEPSGDDFRKLPAS